MAKRSYLQRKLAILPAERRAKVDAMAAQIVESNRLSRLCETLGITQSDLADRQIVIDKL
jgi:hypothetical protein